jgi:hypothetical protein
MEIIETMEIIDAQRNDEHLSFLFRERITSSEFTWLQQELLQIQIIVKDFLGIDLAIKKLREDSK